MVTVTRSPWNSAPITPTGGFGTEGGRLPFGRALDVSGETGNGRLPHFGIGSVGIPELPRPVRRIILGGHQHINPSARFQTAGGRACHLFAGWEMDPVRLSARMGSHSRPRSLTNSSIIVVSVTLAGGPVGKQVGRSRLVWDASGGTKNRRFRKDAWFGGGGVGSSIRVPARAGKAVGTTAVQDASRSWGVGSPRVLECGRGAAALGLRVVRR